MASEARANGICDYRLWTTEELIEGYAWEAKRIDRKSAEHTKKLIRAELRRRFNVTLQLLDDEQTVRNPHGTFRYLIGE